MSLGNSLAISAFGQAVREHDGARPLVPDSSWFIRFVRVSGIGPLEHARQHYEERLQRRGSIAQELFSTARSSPMPRKTCWRQSFDWCKWVKARAYYGFVRQKILEFSWSTRILFGGEDWHATRTHGNSRVFNILAQVLGEGGDRL